MRGVVGCRGHITHGICHREHAPSHIRHRGCGIAAAVRLRQNHPAGRVAASGVACYACVIRLRERKASHTHGFCGDVAGGQGVVALAFRSNMMLYPLRGSQVSFVNC